jgi:hypothetical protein
MRDQGAARRVDMTGGMVTRTLSRIRWGWSAHWHTILLAVAGVAVVLLTVYWSANDQRSQEPTPSEREAICRSAERQLDRFAREHPDVPSDRLRSEFEENCRKAPPLPAVAPE